MSDKLAAYHRKRDFRKTAEPEGGPENRQGRLRFVVQHHFAQAEHYDFRLEWDGVLLSWAVPKGPSYNPGDKRLAVEVEDHPLAYRDFEGTIPKGEYGGGTVMLWDEGYWEPLTDVAQGRRDGSLKIALNGKRLRGKWALVRTKAKPDEARNNWLLIKEKDPYVLDHDGISQYTTSIRTGRTRDEIAEGTAAKGESAPGQTAQRKAAPGKASSGKAAPASAEIRNPFDQTDVMLATLVDEMPSHGDWLYEMKYDGYRIIAFIEDGSVRLITRNGLDYTSRFQRIADSLEDWASGQTMVLDGEVMIRDAQGQTNFQALQNYMRNPGDKDIVYVVFDLLALHGEDLRNNPLIERKAGLEALLADAPEDIHYSTHVTSQDKKQAEALLQTACQAHLEGLVGKRANSIYSGERNGDWIKVKCGNRQEFVIGGYTMTINRTSGFSALLLGVYEGEQLVYAGRAGTGFSAKTFEELMGKFAGIETRTSPFRNAPKRRSNEQITWLKPVFVAEVEFAEWTGDNLLRQASFQGMRADKDPRDVVREIPRPIEETSAEATLAEKARTSVHARKSKLDSALVGGVRLSSPDKVMIDGSDITKMAVARYYEKVSQRMLPYLGCRLLSVVRCPDGTARPCFYHKHPDPDAAGVVRFPVLEDSGKTGDYFYIETVDGLLNEVQMGTLEFHTWGSRVDSLEKPDTMVFDLDPGEGLDIEQVRQGVRDLKRILDDIGLESFLKTSGGKGYHVVVPLEPAADWAAFHEYAKLIAKAMEQQWPDRYTSNIRKVKRQGKVFIDWLRNGRTATSVAPYSVRARAGAPVSMPISWDELDTVAPNGINMDEALKRINENDPWQDFYRVKQRIKA